MKQHSTFIKILAAVLPIFALIGIFVSLSVISETLTRQSWKNYYSWEITDASAEKLDDGRYLINVSVKNTSSYPATLTSGTIWVKCGGKYLDNEYENYENIELYSSLNSKYLPAGQSTVFPIIVDVPKGETRLTVNGSGMSYSRSDVTGVDNDIISVEVKI